MIAAGNVIPPLYHLILEKGYKLEIRNGVITARKNSFSLSSKDIFQLAGLVFLMENKGENWRVDKEQIKDCLTFFKDNK